MPRRALTIAAAALVAVALLTVPGVRPASAITCALADDYYTINEDAGKQGLNVQVNDPCATTGGTFLGFSELDGPLKNADGSIGQGSITTDPDGHRLAYTPPANWNGNVKFAYRIDFACCVSSLAYVSITVRAVNDEPLVELGGGPIETTEDAGPEVWYPSVVLTHPGGGSDEAGQAITVLTSNSNPALFSVEPHFTLGGLAFTSAPNANGVAVVSYFAHDNGGTLYGGSDTQLVPGMLTLVITGVNDAPIGHPDSYTTKMNATLTIAAPGVLKNDTDVDGDPLNLVLDVEPSHGTLLIRETGSFSYVPDPGFSGNDSFIYDAGDGTLHTGPTKVTISVLAPGATAPPPTAAPHGTAPPVAGAATPTPSQSGGTSSSPSADESGPVASEGAPSASPSATPPTATLGAVPAATVGASSDTTSVVIAILAAGVLIALAMIRGAYVLRRRTP